MSAGGSDQPAAPRRASNVAWQPGAVSAADRARRFGHEGLTFWFTGLSGSGKSTIAEALEKALVKRGVFCVRLDGDNLRHGLNSDLGFDDASRRENVRRLGEVAALIAASGGVAIVSAISPFRADRDRCRAIHAEHRDGRLRFLEVFVDAPLAVCESRDAKGLYAKARAGAITGFTGIDAPYEAPTAPELRLDTTTLDVEASVRKCLEIL